MTVAADAHEKRRHNKFASLTDAPDPKLDGRGPAPPPWPTPPYSTRLMSAKKDEFVLEFAPPRLWDASRESRRSPSLCVYVCRRAA